MLFRQPSHHASVFLPPLSAADGAWPLCILGRIENISAQLTLELSSLPLLPQEQAKLLRLPLVLQDDCAQSGWGEMALLLAPADTPLPSAFSPQAFWFLAQEAWQRTLRWQRDGWCAAVQPIASAVDANADRPREALPVDALSENVLGRLQNWQLGLQKFTLQALAATMMDMAAQIELRQILSAQHVLALSLQKAGFGQRDPLLAEKPSVTPSVKQAADSPALQVSRVLQAGRMAQVQQALGWLAKQLQNSAGNNALPAWLRQGLLTQLQALPVKLPSAPHSVAPRQALPVGNPKPGVQSKAALSAPLHQGRAQKIGKFYFAIRAVLLKKLAHQKTSLTRGQIFTQPVGQSMGRSLASRSFVSGRALFVKLINLPKTEIGMRRFSLKFSRSLPNVVAVMAASVAQNFTAVRQFMLPRSLIARIPHGLKSVPLAKDSKAIGLAVSYAVAGRVDFPLPLALPVREFVSAHAMPQNFLPAAGLAHINLPINLMPNVLSNVPSNLQLNIPVKSALFTPLEPRDIALAAALTPIIPAMAVSIPVQQAAPQISQPNLQKAGLQNLPPVLPPPVLPAILQRDVTPVQVQPLRVVDAKSAETYAIPPLPRHADKPAAVVTVAPAGNVTVSPAAGVTPSAAGNVTGAPAAVVTVAPAAFVTVSPAVGVTPSAAAGVTGAPAVLVTATPAALATPASAADSLSPNSSVLSEPVRLANASIVNVLPEQDVLSRLRAQNDALQDAHAVVMVNAAQAAADECGGMPVFASAPRLALRARAPMASLRK